MWDLNELRTLLSDPRHRIELDRVVSEQTREAMKRISIENFPLNRNAPSRDLFEDRLKSYGEAVIELRSFAILAARWGDSDAVLGLQKVLARLSEVDRGDGGFRLWASLSWYPLHLLMYVAGLAALSARRFDSLRAVLLAPVEWAQGKRGPLVIPASANLADSHDGWKLLPGKEQRYTPRSEFLLEELRAPIDDLLFVGGSYESLFDEFELWVAMVFVHAGERDWGPIGRFGWKHDAEDLMDRITKDAQKAGPDWEPLRAGLFGGAPDEFLKAATVIRGLMSRSGWR